VILRDFKISFYVNSCANKLFGNERGSASSSPWVSLYGGMMDVGRRWKGMTMVGRVSMVWCSVYGGGKMETQLSNGENVQWWDDLFYTNGGCELSCPGRVSVSGGVDSMLQFQLQRRGDDTKCCWKIKWSQRVHFCSMGRERDTAWWRNDVIRRRDGTEEGKWRRHR
jgi:hypothetical protein